MGAATTLGHHGHAAIVPSVPRPALRRSGNVLVGQLSTAILCLATPHQPTRSPPPFGEWGPWRVAQPPCQSPSNQPTCSGTLYLVGPDPLDQVCPRFALVASSRPCWFEMNDTTGLLRTSDTTTVPRFASLQVPPSSTSCMICNVTLPLSGSLPSSIMGPLQNTEYSTLTCR